MGHFLKLFLILGLVVGCTKKDKKIEYGLDLKDTLRANIISEPPTLDWNKSTDTTSANVYDNLMEGLTQFDLNDPELNVVPALASEWSSSKDAKVWTFTLRQGVKWSDGVEFEAQQLADGWERLLNPGTAAEYAYFLYYVKNAKQYNDGSLKDFSQVGVKVIDKYKLEVTLERSIAFFPMLLTHGSTFPIRKDLITKYGDAWTQPGKMVTLGPFTLKTWDHDKNIVLERYDGYYGTKPQFKNVLLYMIVEHSTALSLYEGGKLDIVPEVPYTEIGRLKSRKDYYGSTELTSQYYGFNTKKKPFDNPKVRKAIVMAINRDELVKMHNIGHKAATTFVPQGMFGFEEDIFTPFDLEQSKKLLKEAGYEDVSKIPRIVLFFNTNENNQRTAENIQAQLKKNLGLEIEVQNEDWKVYNNRLKTEAPLIWRMAWGADYPDPDNFLNIWITKSGNNYGKWSSAKYDELIEQAAGELDHEKRRKMYREAQEILKEEAPLIPLFYTFRNFMKVDRVKGYKFNALDKRIYKTVKLE